MYNLFIVSILSIIPNCQLLFFFSKKLINTVYLKKIITKKCNYFFKRKGLDSNLK
jgi:uncharacterized membrane protein